MYGTYTKYSMEYYWINLIGHWWKPTCACISLPCERSGYLVDSCVHVYVSPYCALHIVHCIFIFESVLHHAVFILIICVSYPVSGLYTIKKKKKSLNLLTTGRDGCLVASFVYCTQLLRGHYALLVCINISLNKWTIFINEYHLNNL